MGGGASVNHSGNLTDLSAEQVGDLVASIAKVYIPYKEYFIDEGIDGSYLVGKDEASFKTVLEQIGIAKDLHRDNIWSKFQLLGGGSGGGGLDSPGKASSSTTVTGLAANVTEKIAEIIKSLDLPSKVSVSPRKLMSDLFGIQGIALDPSDLDPAINKIAQAVGYSGVCDGKTKYDVFINYRVAADADLAEKVYLYLKTMGIHAFLDKKCLKDGEPWKEGFLIGLSRSRKFLCLISSAALAKVRNATLDHTKDNVLLEYETGQMIRNHLKEVDADLAKSYIIPIHVGHFSQGVLTKFTEFEENLYPDSVGPDGTSIMIPSVDLTTCEGVVSALKMEPLEPAQAEAGLRAMGNLCRLDDNNCVTLDGLGACELIPAVMTNFATTNAFVAAQGLYAMHSIAKSAGNDSSFLNLISDNEEGEKSDEMSSERGHKLVNAGAIDLLVASFRTFSSSPEVVEHACWLVFQLSQMQNDVGSKLVEHGMVNLVQGVLRADTFTSNGDVAKCALCALMCDLPDSAVKFIDDGTLELMLTTMRNFPSSEGVAQFGLGILGYLLTSDQVDEDVAQRFLATGVIEVGVTTIKAFPTHPDVVGSFCFLVLAAGGSKEGASATVKAKLLELNVKPLIEKAMENPSLPKDVREFHELVIDMLSEDKD